MMVDILFILIFLIGTRNGVGPGTRFLGCAMLGYTLKKNDNQRMPEITANKVYKKLLLYFSIVLTYFLKIEINFRK